MAKDQIFSRMATASLALMSKENPRVKASTSGKMAVSTSENSVMDSRQVKARGRSATVTLTAINMTAHMKTIRKMEWARSPGKVATITRVAIKMMNAMAMARCTGKTALATKESGLRASRTG